MDDSDRIDELEQKVKQLTARVRDLEDGVETDGGTRQSVGDDEPFDQYDEPVINHLSKHPGKTYHPRQIVRLYGRHSTIQSSKKRKRRAKKLVESDYFKRVPGGVRFVGPNGGDDE